MVEKRCYFCNRNENETEIVDAIFDSEPLDLCEDCAIINRAVVVKRPTEAELSILSKPSYKFVELRQKIKEGKRINESPRMQLQPVDISKVRERVWKTEEEKRALRAEKIAEKLGERLDINIVQVKEESNVYGNFGEIVRKARESKKLNQRELAESIAESEQTIRSIESNKLPENSEKAVRKLEQFLRIKLEKAHGVNLNSKDLTIGDLKKVKEDMFNTNPEPDSHGIEIIDVEGEE
ncbi:hypothetical protein HZA33_00470 [Candidatus Pacearchaeota archaeon]|nr:hypothetical protein [Candidatus Pacearchaeota archaeon]